MYHSYGNSLMCQTSSKKERLLLSGILQGNDESKRSFDEDLPFEIHTQRWENQLSKWARARMILRKQNDFLEGLLNNI